MVKLVPALFEARRGVVRPVSAVVLQVTERFDPSAALGCTKMRLFAVTAVVSTTQVPVEALVAQLNEPEGAAEQETTEGFAAVPAAAQLVVELNVVPVKVVNEPAAGVVPPIAPGLGKEEVEPPKATEVPAIVIDELARSTLGIELKA